MKKIAVIFALPLLLMAIEVPSATMKQERKEDLQKHKVLKEEPRMQLKERQMLKHEAAKEDRIKKRKKVYPRGTIETH